MSRSTLTRDVLRGMPLHNIAPDAEVGGLIGWWSDPATGEEQPIVSVYLAEDEKFIPCQRIRVTFGLGRMLAFYVGPAAELDYGIKKGAVA